MYNYLINYIQLIVIFSILNYRHNLSAMYNYQNQEIINCVLYICARIRATVR